MHDSSMGGTGGNGAALAEKEVYMFRLQAERSRAIPNKSVRSHQRQKKTRVFSVQAILLILRNRIRMINLNANTQVVTSEQ